MTTMIIGNVPLVELKVENDDEGQCSVDTVKILKKKENP